MIRIFSLTVVLHLVASSPGLAVLTPTWTYQTGAPILSSPKMADLDGDGVKEILVTTFSTNPSNPYDAGYVHVIQSNGTARPGWPFYSSGAPIPATPAIGDLDGDGAMEIVVGSWSRLHAFRPDGTSVPGFPRPFGTSETATLYDLDGDGSLEILYPSNNRIYVMDRFGAVLSGWPFTIQATYIIGSPVVGDIDNDGQVEIVAGSYKGPVDSTPFNVYAWETDGTLVPGWPFATSGVVKACPALADVDGNGDVEIAVGAYHTSNDDYFYLLDGNGSLMPGWPQRAARNRLSPPAFADLNGDQIPEIVVAGGTATAPYNGLLFAFRVDGTLYPNFPVQLTPGGQVNDAPIVLDLDGDGSKLEILVKNLNYIHGYHSDGTPIADFPFFVDDTGHTGTTSPGPLAGDMDGDGDVELVFCSNYDDVFFFDSHGPFDPALAYWPTYKHDARNTGNIGTRDPSASPEPAEYPERAITLSCRPNPFHDATTIAIVHPTLGSPNSIDLLDATGRVVRTLSIGESDRQETVWDGRDATGRLVPQGCYFIRTDGGIPLQKVLLLR